MNSCKIFRLVIANDDPISWRIYVLLGQETLSHLDRISHICITESSAHFRSDTYMHRKSLQGRWRNSVGRRISWCWELTCSGVICWWPGFWFNIKMLSYQYRKFHCGDETIMRLSYLYNGISYTEKILIFSQHPGFYVSRFEFECKTQARVCLI